MEKCLSFLFCIYENKEGNVARRILEWIRLHIYFVHVCNDPYAIRYVIFKRSKRATEYLYLFMKLYQIYFIEYHI